MDPPAMKPPDPVNPMGTALHLKLDAFPVQPGKERQVCKRFNLDIKEPLDVVRMRSEMSGTSHHFNVYKGIGDKQTAPASEQQKVVHDCPPASEQLNGSAAYIFGASAKEKYFDTPAGVAFHLVPGQLIILEQHVINASGAVIQGEATLDLVGSPPGAPVAHHADVMWLGQWGINLPPQKETQVTGRCAMPYPVEVFGLFSHTHALGTHFSIDAIQGGSGKRLYDSFDWEHPLYLPLAPALPLGAGEQLSWTCRYKNTRDKAVTAGKASTDEMCIAFAVGYPKNTQGDKPIQCNVFF